MLNLIKNAHIHDGKLDTIVETCLSLDIDCALLEDLGGTMLDYVQRMKAGKPLLNYDNLSQITNIFAFADLLGATDNREINPRVASALLDVYKSIKPGDDSAAYQRIMSTVDRLSPRVATHFRQAASDWGNTLRTIIDRPNPQAINAIANKLVMTANRVKDAMGRLEAAQGDSITQQKVQNGILGRQLDQSISGGRRAAGL